MIRIAVVACLAVACSGNNRGKEPKHDPAGSGTGSSTAPWKPGDSLPVLAAPAPLPAPPPGLPALDGEMPTPAQVAFGELLFFEPRLGTDGKTACATCHDPDHDWSGAGRQPTAGGAANLRRALAVSNVAWPQGLGLDGRYPRSDGFWLGPVT